jgi:hypothetical protein
MAGSTPEHVSLFTPLCTTGCHYMSFLEGMSRVFFFKKQILRGAIGHRKKSSGIKILL